MNDKLQNLAYSPGSKVKSLLFVSLMLLLGWISNEPLTGQVLAYEGFSSSPGALNGATGGDGWASAWDVQNGDITIPGYNIASGSNLTYSTLVVSGNYAVGGNAYLTSGRVLNMDVSGPFADYLNNGLVGASGKTIYASCLLRKDVNNDDEISFRLVANSNPVVNAVLAAGFFGGNSKTDGLRYWTLQVGSTYLKTSIPVVVGQSCLLVLKITFGSPNFISLYVNPTSIASGEPALASVSSNTTDPVSFKTIAFYGGNGHGFGSIDEIRLGASFADVTPSSVVITGDGKVNREYWLKIAGTTVTDIPKGTKPFGTSELNSLECPENFADSSATRMYGYIVPTTTGNYTFSLASHNDGELWLSSNSDPAFIQKIAYVSGGTGSREWSKDITQTSQSIKLYGGTKYYFEAWQKQGAGGGDNLAVSWTGPGISSISLISGDNISSFTDIVKPTTPTDLSFTNITETSLKLSWIPSIDNEWVDKYEIFMNGSPYGFSDTASMNITSLDAGKTYEFKVVAKDASGNVSDTSASSFVTTHPSGSPAILTFNKTITYQTMAGFGFFGGDGAWWDSGDPNYFFNKKWLDLIIDDLGMSIWRNEFFPNELPAQGQDANWEKQRALVQALKAKADSSGVPLKFLFTVWSPPSAFKCTIVNNERVSGVPNSSGTKWGGALDPAKYRDFANWLKAGISLYKDAGVDLYAISPQNEPYFYEPYNSCFYKQAWYPQMLDSVIPTVKSAFPDVKIFGSENMLEMEGADNNWPWFYHQAIMNDAKARDYIDVWAVHGYSDGVNPSSGSKIAKYWTNCLSHFSGATNKPQWMTETSGYTEKWEYGLNSQGNQAPGAFNLALDIHAGLQYGNMAGWVFWAGSEKSSNGTASEGCLTNDTIVGKKYYVSKHFYHFIRPGAIRVESKSSDTTLFMTAYYHPDMGTHTLIVLNTSDVAKNFQIAMNGNNLPSSFEMYRSSKFENCLLVDTVQSSDVIMIPGRSIITLQAGGSGIRQFIKTHTAQIPVSSVSVEPQVATLVKGQTALFTATVSPVEATNQVKFWASSAPKVAVVDPSGLIAAIDAGTTIITVTTQDGNYTAQVTVKVVPTAIHVISVSLNNTALNLAQNAETTLVATVLPTNATDKTIVWTSNNEKVAKVSVSGIVSTTDSAGTAIITATTTDGHKTATCTISVEKPEALLNAHEEGQLVIYPNPIVGTSAIITWIGFTQPESSVSISDLSGRILITQIVAAGQGKSIPVSLVQLQSGMYLAKCQNKYQTITKRILVK
jgi:glucuronoarabinoxylan endo-1,4-beta-xylanase